MSFFLQGYKHAGSFQLIPSAVVRCRCCPMLLPVIADEPLNLHAGESLTNTEVQEALSEAMTDAGWVNMNCPRCVETRPELAKQDAEEEAA